jgi:hypothetical protein
VGQRARRPGRFDHRKSGFASLGIIAATGRFRQISPTAWRGGA